MGFTQKRKEPKKETPLRMGLVGCNRILVCFLFWCLVHTNLNMTRSLEVIVFFGERKAETETLI